MAQNLFDKREVKYVKLAKEINPLILKDFVSSIIKNFCIKDGRIESILFKNGVEHRFLYKGEDE